MNKSSYEKTYHHLVKQENLAKIKEILKEKESYDPETIGKIQYKKEKELPYLFVQVDSGVYLGQGNYGMVDGNFVNIESICPQWTDVFYLPILFLRQPADPKLKELVEKRKIKEHEIEHLKDLLDYIDEHPSYIKRAQKYSLSGCTLENVGKSIHFEVEKIFQKEAPVLAKDYRNGETCVSISADGAAFEIEVDTEARFVEYEIGLYLGSLFERYLEKFPEHKELIENLYKKEVDTQGRAFFGKNALQKIVFSIMELFSLRHNPLRATRYEVGEFD